jgi:hypothetical protein
MVTKIIGLLNLEPKVVNTAMMQVSSYHKSIGDHVEFYSALWPEIFDKVYAFSIFDFSSRDYVTSDMVVGGTGFDHKVRLPGVIEDMEYDWSLFPDCDFSIQWFSRGCIRSCPFCVVPEKEGGIHSVIPKNLNPNGSHVKVLDNNFFANPLWNVAIDYLNVQGQPVDFHQGIDIRIVTDEMVEALKSLKFSRKYSNIRFAWDDPKVDLRPKIGWFCDRIKPYRLMCYVLIGYWSSPKEDLWRVEELRKLGVSPFVMPYDKSDPYQADFARWVNHKATWKSCSWEEYKKRK